MTLNERRYFLGGKGTRWAFSAYHIGDGDDSYMRRWIFRTPWCSFRLHHILRSDRADALHDHPADFYVLIVRGEYHEVTATGTRSTDTRYWPAWSFRKIRADQPHRLVLERPVWTVSVAVPANRKWGFYPKRYDQAGFIPAGEYLGDAERGHGQAQ